MERLRFGGFKCDGWSAGAAPSSSSFLNYYFYLVFKHFDKFPLSLPTPSPLFLSLGATRVFSMPTLNHDFKTYPHLHNAEKLYVFLYKFYLLSPIV